MSAASSADKPLQGGSPGDAATPAPRGRRGVAILLWVLAALVMLGAYVYQKYTGPTYPYRARLELGGKTHKLQLVRSQENTEDARVAVPAPEGVDVQATLSWRRYRPQKGAVQDPFTTLEMPPEPSAPGATTRELAARLPKQPAAGKLEYFVEVKSGGVTRRLPEQADEYILIRFKNPVPDVALYPHILLMFFAILIGMRAGWAALFAPARGMRWGAWVALAGMTVGGMILGPVVQKFAFGEYWSGFPFKSDWTDNKMLVMWLAWIFACAVIGFRATKWEGLNRGVVVLAAIVMTIVYAIPHSMHGSQLDYGKLEQGVDPTKAIETGH